MSGFADGIKGTIVIAGLLAGLLSGFMTLAAPYIRERTRGKKSN